jgi:spore coat polysaccharide biosynthesis protein SpsF
MKVGFVIPSRLKSSRLKKKILMKLGEQSALDWAIDRARLSNSIDEVVVATTPLASDSEISKVCSKKAIRYFQGDPDDVLKRLRDTAEYFSFDYVVNITPDNTLFSIYLIDLMVSKIKENPNVDFFRYKDAMLGTGIYALKTNALKTICEFKDLVDTEIWGPLFHKDYFEIEDIEMPEFLNRNYRLTMDTELDYIMLNKVYKNLNISKENIVELREVIEYLDENPDVRAINESVVQNSVPTEILDKIDESFKKNENKFYEIRKKYYEGENL